MESKTLKQQLHLDRNQIFEKLKTVDLPEQSFYSCFKNFKYMCVISKISGFLPVQNLFKAKAARDLSFKKCSFAYIVGWFILLIKWVLWAEVFTPIHLFATITTKNETIPSFSKPIVDQMAEAAGSYIYFMFGIVAHMLIMCQAKEFVLLIQAVEKFEKSNSQQVHSSVPKLFTFSIICSILCSMFTVLTELLQSYWKHILVGKKGGTIMGLAITTPEVSISIQFLIGIIIEYGTLFLYIQLLHTGNVLKTMLSDISEEVTYKMIIHSPSRKSASTKQIDEANTKKEKIWMHRVKSGYWIQLGNRYMELKRIFCLFEAFCGPYLIVTLTFLVSSAVFSIYSTTSIDDNYSLFQNLLTQTFHRGITCVVFGRIMLIANLGESIKKEHHKLVKSVLNLNLNHNMDANQADEVSDFCRKAA
jgi:hypothetical protein